MNRNLKKAKQSKADKVFNTLDLILMVLMLVIFAWPLWFIVIASVSDPAAVVSGEVLLLPKKIQFDGYKLMLE